MRPFKKEKSMARAKHLSFCRIQLVQFYICRFFGAPILTGIDVHTPFCRTLTPFLTTVACTKSRSTRMAGKSLDIYTMSELIPFLYTNWDISYARTPALIFHHESHISPVLDSNCSTVEYCVPGHFRTGSCVAAI
jgi:hypothetical protein